MSLQVLSTFIFLLIISSIAEFKEVYDLDDSVGYGRKFDGIGGISGGGATSKLLMNYPEPQRSEILDYLFKPDFAASLQIFKLEIGGDGESGGGQLAQSGGYVAIQAITFFTQLPFPQVTDPFDTDYEPNFAASLHILKVEIGGDGQSTDGTEASHMHTPWDENYERGYEWWLMVEAKKRNPDIKLYGLPWSFPGWLNKEGVRNPYTYPEITSAYVIKWIQGAKIYYNLTIDYVGIWNEKDYDKTYIKTLRKSLDAADLQHVRIVAPDAPHINDWKICADISNDPDLAMAVDIVGCHYPGTITTAEAVSIGKPLWASEDYSTFNDIVGGGCWARLLNQNYVNGNITGTISWNLIAAYYDSLPYTRDGLMTAESPWSGNYVVETPIWMTAHTTQFTQIGWYYLKHGHGAGHFLQGGSYVTFTDPSTGHVTIVMETVSHDHSKCIRPFLPPYTVAPQNVTLQLKGSLSKVTEMYVWYSQLLFDGRPSVLFQRKDPVKVVDGTISLYLDVDVVYTLTTVSTGNKGTHPPPPPQKKFPLPYREDFEGYSEHAEPYNLAQQTGAYEVIQTNSKAHGKVMRQMVQQMPIYWCAAEKLNLTLNLLGNVSWTTIYIEVEAKLGDVNGTDGVFLAALINQGGCDILTANGIYFFLYPKTKQYMVTGNAARTKIYEKGTIEGKVSSDWNRFALLVKDNMAVGGVNGDQLFSITVPSHSHGFAGLGTASYGLADFDNLMLMSFEDGEKRLQHQQANRKSSSDDTLYFKPLHHSSYHP